MSSRHLALVLPTLHPQTADDMAQRFLTSYHSGSLSETETRRQIAAVLYQTKIHEEVASRHTELTQQTRSDLGEILSSRIFEKMMDGKSFCLTRGQTVSVCGWARQFAVSMVKSEMRNMSRSAVRNGSPLDPSGYEFAAAANSTPPSASLLAAGSANQYHFDGDVAHLVEDFMERSRGMRGVDRMVASAESLCHGLGVEGAVRPLAAADREYCLQVLDENDENAYTSLRAWVDLVQGSDSAAIGDCDDRMMSLWDDQTEDSATALLKKAPYVAHMLAVAAVSPLPRPPKRAIRHLRARLSALEKTRLWRQLVSVLVDAYVAAQFEAISQYTTVPDEERKALLVGHEISKGRLEMLVARAVTWPGQPLGASPNAVLIRLGDVCTEALDEANAAKAAAAEKSAARKAAAARGKERAA